MAIAKPLQQSICPQEASNMRKATAVQTLPDKRFEILPDGTWAIYGFSEVRQILRSPAVRQAGFLSESLSEMTEGFMKHLPILYLEGEAHHKARRETNRFFTPRATDRDYRDFMNAYADDLMAQLQRQKRADVSDLSMKMAVQVASRIVGLTSSYLEAGLQRRLEAMIQIGDALLDGPGPVKALRSNWRTMTFYFLDVLPAIRARRNKPAHDVISYLIERDYSNLEIMTECIVYGVAGMVTTREFISVALWHLFENPALMERMKVGEEAERHAILHEILRLEPVVSHLYRRATDALTFESEGQTIAVPANTRFDLHIIAANADEQAMGTAPEAICPMRETADMKPKVPEYGLSFGDGSHRCPGAYVAIQESDIFLQKLLALPNVRVESGPDVHFFRIAESYEVRNFIIAVD